MPKYFFRRCLFWAVIVVQVPLQLALMLIDLAIALCQGFEEVLRVANFRFECWAHGVPKGHFHNCPWKNSFLKAWKDGFYGRQ